MTDTMTAGTHGHVFLGEEHDANKQRTWWVIGLCGAMMALEIGGGLAFGSIALVADGLHMSAHAGALLLAALAYSFASRHATDRRFSFGTGKLGDLAGFSSAIVLAMIAFLIGYEAVSRFFVPVPIRFAEAIPIAVLGLAVNVASVWLLSGGGHHHHGHSHGHGHSDGAHDHDHDDEEQHVSTESGSLAVSIHEDGVPPHFRVGYAGMPAPRDLSITTTRPDGASQLFLMVDRGGYLESADEIPEPHAFKALLRLTGEAGGREHELTFAEHDHGDEGTHRDNNMRAAVVHVLADAAVSVLVILGLVLARVFGWLWMDPLASIIGAFVIAAWSYALVRDTGAVLLDMVPDQATEARIRQMIEGAGDRLTDLHLWRLGPGHLGAILSVATRQGRDSAFYRQQLRSFKTLSHVTVEVTQA